MAVTEFRINGMGLGQPPDVLPLDGETVLAAAGDWEISTLPAFAVRLRSDAAAAYQVMYGDAASEIPYCRDVGWAVICRQREILRQYRMLAGA